VLLYLRVFNDKNVILYKYTKFKFKFIKLRKIKKIKGKKIHYQAYMTLARKEYFH